MSTEPPSEKLSPPFFHRPMGSKAPPKPPMGWPEATYKIVGHVAEACVLVGVVWAFAWCMHR